MGKTSRTLQVVDMPATDRALIGHRVGTVVAFDDGCWSIECDATSGPVRARTTLALDPAAMQCAASKRQTALIVFENECAALPIVIGLLASPGTTTAPAAAAPKPIEALVDGQRIVLEGRDEIVLRCGQASITLRRNGRVVIRGTYVETRSQGTNRIKGGNVQIN